ncbi:MAG: FtsQ-type POTRA domain-containing protein, partial [Deltaproteobacteria bacterium]|nr:FtsQ-type POTRA domain-containing protein [Deltaproteobacteria bacterium]
MKRKSVLKKQAAKKKKRHPLPRMWRGVTVTAAFFLRFAFFGIALILISLVFVLLYEYMLTSPYIRLEKIVVTGVDSAMKDDILEKAELGPDSSLLGIDLENLKSTLEQNPWIQSIRLEKQFPHTLIIHAVKEEPWAVAAMGDLYFVNRAGKIFVEEDG